MSFSSNCNRMGSKSGQDVDLYGTSFSIESIKVIAESIGIGNLPDEAAKELADDVSYRVKHIIQDAGKFMRHAKRMKLLNMDIDSALKTKNLEVGFWLVNLKSGSDFCCLQPQYGFHSKDPLPFRFASGGGRELHFIEEKEVDLNELVQNTALKTPLEVTLRYSSSSRRMEMCYLVGISHT